MVSCISSLRDGWTDANIPVFAMMPKPEDTDVLQSICSFYHIMNCLMLGIKSMCLKSSYISNTFYANYAI